MAGPPRGNRKHTDHRQKAVSEIVQLPLFVESPLGEQFLEL